MNFFQRRKINKFLKQAIRHAKTMRASREDIMNTGERNYLDDHLKRAAEARKQADPEVRLEAAKALDAAVDHLFPPKPLAGWRENFDVLVVAVSVAMAFRAYFYQPFKIPTGSMQPTLYGIHTETLPPEAATWLDKQPFRFFKWCVTGESFKVVRAKANGTITVGNVNQSKKPGYTPLIVGGYPHYVPNDVVANEGGRPVIHLGERTLGIGTAVRAGDVLWSGKVISGDFVFVNRWYWNFHHPKRGEVMVFATNGIGGLQQGTHYIKRMTGLPNETLAIKAPNLLVNGQVVTEPEKIGQIARQEKLAPWAPPYAGFNPCGPSAQARRGLCLTNEREQVKRAGDQYYAMGDNSFNSFDSRYWGPVPERNLLGPAAVVYWPFTSPRFGRIR